MKKYLHSDQEGVKFVRKPADHRVQKETEAVQAVEPQLNEKVKWHVVLLTAKTVLH